MTVLVCGATGTTGAEVARRLTADGVEVRAMTRSGRSAARLRDAGLDAVVADLAEPASLPAALDGVDAVYVATSSSPQLPALEANLAHAAVQAGVAQVVKLSVIGAQPDSPLRFARLHHAAEREIQRAGVGWTMVRPNGFMQNTLAWAPQIAAGAVHGPVMDARWSIVDVRDVAALAVAALRAPDLHVGRTYIATGPALSSPREQVAALAGLLGRPIAAHDVSIHDAQQSLRAGGWPAWAAEGMAELFELYARGEAHAVSADIERVTGHPARSYEQFLEDHRVAFEA